MTSLERKTLGSFELLAPLGSGAMGEVYRARDATLGRDVAIKVLPEVFVQDENRLARFEREARLLASLNHPNIASIHEVGQDGDARFLVLELVPGETIEEKLKRGVLSVGEAKTVFTQIASALESAHERGIVHRDLKPANVMLSDDGRVKLLDFGLARASEEPIVQFANDATEQTFTYDGESAGVTGEGRILGTPAYMAPEQASGRPVDKRADIWAFGCCLYEALSGERPFVGDTATQLMAGIIERDPVWEKLPKSTPGRLRLLLWRCLQKDPHRRLRDIGEARFELSETGSDASLELPGLATTTQTRIGHGRLLGGVAIGLALGVAAVLLFGGLMSDSGEIATPGGTAPTAVRPVERSIFRVDTEPVTGLHVHHFFGEPAPCLALSPAGRRLAYVVKTELDQTQLYIRNMDSFAGTPLPGTAGGMMPFFSPDGNSVGFFTENELRIVPVQGGTPQTLCDVRTPFGGCWASDGTIYFSESLPSRISSVKASGGAKQLIYESTSLLMFPVLGSREKGLLLNDAFAGASTSFDFGRILYLDLDQPPGETHLRTIYEGGHTPCALSSGQLLFMRGDAVYALSLDLSGVTGSVTQPVVVLDGVLIHEYAVSQNGHLAYVAGHSNLMSQMVWVDRQGVEEPLPAPVRNYGTFDLSPDGRRVAAQVLGVRDQIRVYDVASGREQQLTDRGESCCFPLWSPDSKGLAYSRKDTGATSVLWKRNVSASTPPVQLLEMPDGPALGLTAFLTSETEILCTYSSSAESSTLDIGVLSLNKEESPQPLISSAYSELDGTISPDGKWIAFASDRDGQYQVHVRAWPLTDERFWRVSEELGEEPIWSPAGDELFYRSGNRLMSVRYQSGPEFTHEPSTVAWEGRFRNPVGISYDVSSDGQRFLILKPAFDDTDLQEIRIVENWSEEVNHALQPVTE
jgi:serine/threonine protein kinase/Tol biopolymer transport system component